MSRPCFSDKRFEADELLVYERLTGEFHVPGKGKVFLYDRSDNSGGPGMSSQTTMPLHARRCRAHR